MTDHLPECEYEERANYTKGVCVCPELRACEQRAYTLGIEVGKHDGWLAGHAAGVQAAYSAVELRWAKEPDAASDWLLIALAAIDALRNDND